MLKDNVTNICSGYLIEFPRWRDFTSTNNIRLNGVIRKKNPESSSVLLLIVSFLGTSPTLTSIFQNGCFLSQFARNYMEKTIITCLMFVK